jgi:hypothetical protein
MCGQRQRRSQQETILCLPQGRAKLDAQHTCKKTWSVAFHSTKIIAVAEQGFLITFKSGQIILVLCIGSQAFVFASSMPFVSGFGEFTTAYLQLQRLQQTIYISYL